jgi:hypothetical protein
LVTLVIIFFFQYWGLNSRPCASNILWILLDFISWLLLESIIVELLTFAVVILTFIFCVFVLDQIIGSSFESLLFFHLKYSQCSSRTWL